MSDRQAQQTLTEHRFYQYRGCAPVPSPDAEFPGQSLGDPGLSVDAWTASAGEAQQQAAAAVCARCPVLEACKADAFSETPGRVPEEINDVRGGLLPAEIRQIVDERRRGPRSQAWRAFVDHPHYVYRSCAPDPDDPRRSLGDPEVPVNAWLTPRDEPQKERLAREKRAQAVCVRCPVLEACRTYALSETPGSGGAKVELAEPTDIWGGTLPPERRRILIRRRQAAGVQVVPSEARTPQKLAVLLALAQETDEELVAYRAGMDQRTSNWHRAMLCGLLGLDRETATRGELLKAAQQLWLLPADVRVRPDGPLPIAAAPSTDGVRQRRIRRRHMDRVLERVS